MIVTTVKCEMCEEHFLVYPHQQQYEWNVPAGWLIVIEGSPHDKEGSHFCSTDCLSAWLVEKKALNESKVSAHD